MALLAPPPDPPQGTVTGQDEPNRLRQRLTQVVAALLTVLVTTWVCTLGVVPAIIALSLAKHILVAVLMRALGVDALQEK
jgi:hypothetical protein